MVTDTISIHIINNVKKLQDMEGNKLVKQLLRSKCRSAFYKNRPRPLPKRLRKYMQSDCVLDEHNHTVSIAEYNYMHNTN